MNAIAVWIGLFYGVITAVVCYILSMMTAGLFARSFYRLYARVLISICLVMLLAPGLRLLANKNSQLAVFGLTLAHYAVMGVLGYGVVRFNREYLKKVFLERNTAAYFTFGTLAYAAIVTLAFLHVSITGRTLWHGHGQTYIGASQYGPLLVMLAAMVLHTDYHLKHAVGNLRRFSQFTFVGYAISFLGLALSIMPYVGNALSQLGLATIDGPLLQNYFSAQALLLAIILYAWLVDRYESIPPLFLMLLATIGEYHVLVTQWLIQAFGPSSWGLASLPLFAVLAFLEHYFANWDKRKRHAAARCQSELSLADTALRFAMPFRFVEVGLAISLLSITLWTRFSDTVGNSANWLAATFGIYGCFFLMLAIFRKSPALVYVSGFIAGLAALLGQDSPGGPMSAALLSGLAVAWGAIAFFGEGIGLKLKWRAPLADCCLLSAISVTAIVFSRHLVGQQPYHFQAVGILDGLALGFAAIAYAISGHHYRSKLPVYGVLLALATIIPPWSAALALLATAAAAFVQRLAKQENAIVLEDRGRLLGISYLPFKDVLPELYVQPLSMGAIPLALIGLLTSASHVIQGDFSNSVLAGSVASALGLGVLTRTHRIAWLYVLAVASTYFSVHAIAHGRFFAGWPPPQIVSAHLLVAAALSLFGWIAATIYAAWCAAMLNRVAEDKEADIRSKRSFYVSWLYDVVIVAGCLTLAGILAAWLRDLASPIFLFFAASLTSVLFTLAASVYRSQVGAYLSLTALTLAMLNAFSASIAWRWDTAEVVAGMGLFAAATSCVAWKHQFAASSYGTDSYASWKTPFPFLGAVGLGLWIRPLAVYSIVCGMIAIIITVPRFDEQWTVGDLSPMAPLTFAMASGIFLLCTRPFRFPPVYLVGIALGYAAAHTYAALALTGGTFGERAQLVHIALAGALSLASCCIAIACAWVINRKSKGTGDDQRASLLANREFYAGILQHFAFAASCVVFAALARLVVMNELANWSDALMSIFIGLLLTVTFSVLGFIYHSRIHTYCALAAVCFSLNGIVTLLIPEAYRLSYQTVTISISALLTGLISWTMVRRQQHAVGQTSSFAHGVECWAKPPLPLVSMNASLWAKPLAHFSVFLALLGLYSIGRGLLNLNLPSTEVWLQALPIYLAAVAFFIATKTHRFSGFVVPPSPSDLTKRAEFADLVERRFYYVFSLLTFGLAMHITLQLQALGRLPFQLALCWHAFLAALLAITGWSLATLYTLRSSRQLKASPDQLGLRQELELYGGLLYHVTVFVAALALGGAFTCVIAPAYHSAPLLGSLGLLIVFFGLASATYRSQLGGYISLITLGLATLHVSSIAFELWPAWGSPNATAIAGLGLILALLASLANARSGSRKAESQNSSWLPSPWSQPLPEPLFLPLAIWIRPLRDVAIFYAVVALMLMVNRAYLDSSWSYAPVHDWITYACVAATFATAARLYNTSILTYAAAITVTLSTIPQWIIFGEPIGGLSILLSLVAMLFWLAGFAVERYSVLRNPADTELLATSSFIRIYERPLVRCSAIVATLGIAHSLLIWKMHGWNLSQTPLMVACMLGAVILLLNARSLTFLQRATRARMLVYLACISFNGGWIVITSMTWGFNGLGPSLAITACIQAIIGLLLIESSQAMIASKPMTAESRLTFGEPISHFASGLSVLAVVIALIEVIGSLSVTYALLEMPNFQAEFEISQLIQTSTALLISAVVCLLSIRAQRDIRWLYGVVIFGCAGLCLLAERQTGWYLGPMAVGTLLLMNSLVAIARLMRFNRAWVASMLGVSQENCEGPVYKCAFVVTTALLIAQSVFLAYIFHSEPIVRGEWPWLWVNLLTVGFYFHLLYLQPYRTYAHLLVGASVFSALAIGTSSHSMLTADLVLSGLAVTWGILAGLLNRPTGTLLLGLLRLPLESSQRESGERLLLSWAVGLFILSIAITIPIWSLSQPSIPNVTITLFLASLASVTGGFRWRSVHAETVAALLFPVSLVSAIDYYGRQDALLEFGSLMLAGLALAYFGIGRIAWQRGHKNGSAPFFSDIGSSLITLSYVLSLGAVLVASVSIVQSSPATPIAISFALISVCWLWMAWISGNEVLVYGAFCGFLVTLFYSAHTLLGTPFTSNPTAAFFVIGYSFLLYGTNILASRSEASRAKVLLRPTYYMAIALPSVLIVTIPFDQRATAAFALLAAGAFYLLIARQSQIRAANYVAAVLVNIAIYLWIPSARELTGLFQLYVIPAAITVLIFAQLHRHELQAKVLTSIRLAASGTILAVSTYEVFFMKEPSLLEFVVVLLLSLGGITLGIALRIKPFIYVGIAFLVINVVGQLGVQFHREGGVVRAIILIGIGLAILGLMIFFNIHRERIIQRYRSFQIKWE